MKTYLRALTWGGGEGGVGMSGVREKKKKKAARIKLKFYSRFTRGGGRRELRISKWGFLFFFFF